MAACRACTTPFKLCQLEQVTVPLQPHLNKPPTVCLRAFAAAVSVRFSLASFNLICWSLVLVDTSWVEFSVHSCCQLFRFVCLFFNSVNSFCADLLHLLQYKQAGSELCEFSFVFFHSVFHFLFSSLVKQLLTCSNNSFFMMKTGNLIVVRLC